MKVVQKSQQFALKSLVMAFLLSLTLDCFPVKSQPTSTVKIDVNIPLTGPISAYTGKYPNGLAMGIGDGANFYKIPRSTFSLDIQDNAGNTANSVSVLQKQLLGSPSVYISGTSAISSAVAPEVSKLGIPHLFIAFDAFITKGDVNRLRILPNYNLEASIYLSYIKSRKAKKVYIISASPNSFEEQFAKIIEPSLDKIGVEHKREVFDLDNKDYRTLALKAAQYKPDLIIISGYSFNLYPLMKALRSNNLVKNGSVISTLDFVDLLYNQTPKNELTGFAFVAPLYEIPGAIKGLEDFRSRYTKIFGTQPRYVEAYAYDTGRILVAAFKKEGTVTEASIRSVLPFQGVTGQIKLENGGDIAVPLVAARVNSRGIVERINLK